MAPAGASLTGVTVSKKLSDTESVPSDAVTLSDRMPLKFNGGVPEKVCVVALNDYLAGKPAPLVNVAV